MPQIHVISGAEFNDCMLERMIVVRFASTVDRSRRDGGSPASPTRKFGAPLFGRRLVEWVLAGPSGHSSPGPSALTLIFS